MTSLFGQAASMPTSKQVFALRKAGELDRALDMARGLFARTPADEWVIRAYAWCLVDAVKRCLRNRDEEGAGRQYALLAGLVMPAGDEILTNQVQWCAMRVEKPLEKITDLNVASRDVPETVQEHTSLGWEIARRLKAQAALENPDKAEIANLLAAYRRLGMIEKPGLLHSMVLGSVTSLAGELQNYGEFLAWWDLEMLRDDDYKRYRPANADKDLPSLAERVAKPLFNSVKSSSSNEAVERAEAFIASLLERFPDNEWLPYYEGRLLLRLDRREDARKLVLPVIRRKQGDFWAWELLSETVEPEKQELKMACLCRALLCRVKEERLRCGVHLELGLLLTAMEKLPEAKHELLEAKRLRQAEKWSLPEALTAAMADPWFEETQEAEGIRAFYEEAAGAAGELLRVDLPWHAAVVTGMVPANQDNPSLCFIGLNDRSGELLQFKVKQGRFSALASLKRGDPVRVQLDKGREHLMVVGLEGREGVAWDALKARVGVVVHVNAEKGVFRVVFGSREGETILGRMDRYPAASELVEGATVAVRLRKDAVKGWMALDVQPTGEKPPVTLLQRFEGRVELPASGDFGFVDHRVFVPPWMMEQAGLQGGERVAGEAVCEWNEKKRVPGWRALRVEVVEKK